MQIKTHEGGLRLSAGPFNHCVKAAWRDANAWRPLELRPSGDAFVAVEGPVRVRLVISPSGESSAYALSFESAVPTRIQLALELPDAGDPFHLLPGFLFGDNNLGPLVPGVSVNLTRLHPDSPSCSPYWECRADRASHPASIAVWDGGLAAVSIQPYSEGRPIAGNAADEGFVRNGVFARLAGDGAPAACGVTLGYGNLPKTFLAPGQFTAPTAHFAHRGEARGRVFLRPAEDRRAAHAVVRELYAEHRDRPRPPISRERAARDLVVAFNEINWHGEDGRNAAGTSAGVATPFFGGKPFVNNFTNMRCGDEARRRLVAWRTLAEIGWSGGGVIGYPLLRAGWRFGDALAQERGACKLDRAADAYNPASGLLFDVSGVNEGKRVNWWWSAPPYADCHCAYTNASAVYYLLKSCRFVRESMATPPAGAEAWLRTALRALDTVVSLQLADGNLGTTYRTDRPEIIDAQGFAGAWFIPGLALAYHFTRERKYLDAAARALAHYHADVRRLSCWGTPMDVGRMVDHEGNLGFLRGAALLREFTGSGEFLEAAVDGAGYEYLWRYGFRTRPQQRPLRDSPWNSCGGSITSAGTSVHPMGVYVAADLTRLAEWTGDAYHRDRADDGLDWAANTVALYPDTMGYAPRGVLTERYCASDGALLESYPDGTPASVWFSYNGWAAGAALEGLVESL